MKLTATICLLLLVCLSMEQVEGRHLSKLQAKMFNDEIKTRIQQHLKKDMNKKDVMDETEFVDDEKRVQSDPARTDGTPYNCRIEETTYVEKVHGIWVQYTVPEYICEY